MSDKETAEKVLKEIGGSKNIDSFTHCATRLRFVLKDSSIPKKEKIEKIQGVLAVIDSGNELYQVVIGPGVELVYNEITTLIEKKGGLSESAKKDVKDKSIDEIKQEHRAKVRGKKAVDTFFDYLSDSFRPILGVLLAASLVIAAINLLRVMGVIPDDTCNATVVFFKSASQGVFYFIPIMIAYNACKKLKVDPWVGAAVMGALMSPSFLSLADPQAYSELFNDQAGFNSVLSSITEIANNALGTDQVITLQQVMGLPMIIADYSGSVFVPLLMAPVVALCYKLLKKVIPSNLHLIFVPAISFVVTLVLTGFIIGPLGIILGNWIGIGLSSLNTSAPLVLVFIIPMIYPFLVPLGLHWPLNALMLANISTLGYDFIQGPMGIYDFACYGASFGVLIISLREKNTEMRSIAAGAVAAGILGGISEPSLYGIHLRFKRAYPIMIAGCVIGAIAIGVLGLIFPASNGVHSVVTDVFAFTSVFTIPVFDNMFVYAASIAIAFFSSALLMLVFDYRTKEQKEEDRKKIADEQKTLKAAKA